MPIDKFYLPITQAATNSLTTPIFSLSLKKQNSMASFEWKGVFPALLTPFNDQDQVDLLMYETNFTPLEFNYPNPQELKLNYDLGNLNCDIKHPIENRVWNISALTGNMLGLGLGFGYATTASGTLNGSYRELDGFTYSGTYGAVVGAPVSNFAIANDKGFAINLRFKMEGNNSINQTIFELGSIMTLDTLGTATGLTLKWRVLIHKDKQYSNLVLY